MGTGQASGSEQEKDSHIVLGPALQDRPPFNLLKEERRPPETGPRHTQHPCAPTAPACCPDSSVLASWAQTPERPR